MNNKKIIKVEIPKEIWDAHMSIFNFLNFRDIIGAWRKSIEDVVNQMSKQNEMNNTPIFQNTEITQNYIEKDGCFEIRYNHTKKQFEVFTVPTQRFYINSLEELTPEGFMLEEERQKQYQKDLAEMFRLYHELREKQNENE